MTATATGRFSRFRRLARLLAVPMLLALLCAQHAALLHGLGHATTGPDVHALASAGSSPAGDPSSNTGGGDAGAHCDKCFQFAHFSDLAFAPPPAPVTTPARNELARAELFSDRAADAPVALSRGPPRTL
jgi:hypothetical protein